MYVWLREGERKVSCLKACLYRAQPQTQPGTRQAQEREREREHERKRERGVRTELRVSNLYESVYTKSDHGRGWKLVCSKLKSQRLPPERVFRRWSHELFLVNQSVLFFFRVTRPR